VVHGYALSIYPATDAECTNIRDRGCRNARRRRRPAARPLEFRGSSKAANLVRIADKSEIGIDDRQVPKALEAWTMLCIRPRRIAQASAWRLN
jgi:hypothetical protein